MNSGLRVGLAALTKNFLRFTSCEDRGADKDVITPPARAPRLREWLARDEPFSLAVSQGFGCEFQSLGATLGLADACGGEGALLHKQRATSGASSGAKIAALAASADVSLEHSARVILGVRAADVFLDASKIVPPWRSGLFGGENVMRLMRALFGGGSRVDDRAIPFGCTAFDLTAWRSVNLTRGDLAHTCAASGAFPVIWAPLRVPAADVGEILGLSRNGRKRTWFSVTVRWLRSNTHIPSSSRNGAQPSRGLCLIRSDGRYTPRVLFCFYYHTRARRPSVRPSVLPASRPAGQPSWQLAGSSGGLKIFFPLWKLS